MIATQLFIAFIPSKINSLIKSNEKRKGNYLCCKRVVWNDSYDRLLNYFLNMLGIGLRKVADFVCN